MSTPHLRELTQISFVNLTHLQHYELNILPSGLLSPDFLAFFTIHTSGGDLLYVSETTVASKQAQFGPFSLASAPRNLHKITLLLWIRTPGTLQYNVFTQVHLDVRNLVRVNGSVGKNLIDNATVWAILDSSFCLKQQLKSDPSKGPDVCDSKEKLSYTVDDIRHLGNLIAGVRDFTLGKNAASAEINALSSDRPKNVEEAIYKTEKLVDLIAKQESQIETIRSEMYLTKKKSKDINTLVKEEYPLFKTLCTDQIELVESQILPIYEALESTIYLDMLRNIRLLALVLTAAYPIDLLPSTGRYCIVGLEFPTSIQELLSMCYNHGPSLRIVDHEAGDVSIDDGLPISIINSGISHIISLMSILAAVFEIRLKHEVKFSGSKCFIVKCGVPESPEDDQVQETDPQYPLYFDQAEIERVTCLKSSEHEMKNVRFEKALTLLQSNLAQLSAHTTAQFSAYRNEDPAKSIVTVPLDCQDNFLWHLHFLLLYVTAS